MEDVRVAEASDAEKEEESVSATEDKPKGAKPDLGTIAQRLNDEFANDKKNLAKAIGFERKRQKEKVVQKLRARKAMLMLRRKRRAAQGNARGKLVPTGAGRTTPKGKPLLPPTPKGGTPKGAASPARTTELALQQQYAKERKQSQLPQQTRPSAGILAMGKEDGKDEQGGSIGVSLRGHASSRGKVGDPHLLVVKSLSELGDGEDSSRSEAAVESKADEVAEGKQADGVDGGGGDSGVADGDDKGEGKEQGEGKVMTREPKRVSYSKEETEAINLFVETHLSYAPADMLGTVPKDVERSVSDPIWASFHHYAMAENPREGSSIGPNKFGSFIKECSCGPAIRQSDIDLSFQSFARE